jgi:hypothetical protein
MSSAPVIALSSTAGPTMRTFTGVPSEALTVAASCRASSVSVRAGDLHRVGTAFDALEQQLDVGHACFRFDLRRHADLIAARTGRIDLQRRCCQLGNERLACTASRQIERQLLHIEPARGAGFQSPRTQHGAHILQIEHAAFDRRLQGVERIALRRQVVVISGGDNDHAVGHRLGRSPVRRQIELAARRVGQFADRQLDAVERVGSAARFIAKGHYRTRQAQTGDIETHRRTFVTLRRHQVLEIERTVLEADQIYAGAVDADFVHHQRAGQQRQYRHRHEGTVNSGKPVGRIMLGQGGPAEPEPEVGIEGQVDVAFDVQRALLLFEHDPLQFILYPGRVECDGDIQHDCGE